MYAFLNATDADFLVLQSRAFEVWARRWCGTLGETLQFASTDGFETYPFPPLGRVEPSAFIARTLFDFRSKWMIAEKVGLTEVYNRFHDPDERSPDILRLRELHAAMDRAVLDAYGWTDIPTDCEFLLDYEIDEATWGTKKKPWRYRWPDAVRDEVLARLLDLNQKRYQEEVAAGLHGKVDKAPPAKKDAPKAPRKPKAAAKSTAPAGGRSEPLSLFTREDPDDPR